MSESSRFSTSEPLNRPAEASTTSPPARAAASPAEAKVDAHPDAVSLPAPIVVAIVVTWNRNDMVQRSLDALARQQFPLDHLHVVVVDNASTDHTLDHLGARFHPETIVENPASAAHEPAFQLVTPGPERTNRPGFASLTLIHNHQNFGGCGGFNTGLAYAARLVRQGLPLDFVWLVDDDAEVPSDALSALTSAAAGDPAIGIVGSRTVDAGDRLTTIESTIYFDFNRGRFSDEPTVNHRLRTSHDEWIRTVGATKGCCELTGIRDVDVVSACSLLARWSAVEEVGFWDPRYFIYCDDADWCLRFGRAGYRVVCNLDAVVYHTPWNLKLTPARLYYAQRNIVWTMQKILPTWRLRYATGRWLLAILRQSVRAAFHRRHFHARVLRRTAVDIMDERAGKLDLPGPTYVAVLDAIEAAGAVGPDRTLAVVCPNRRAIRRADELRASLTNHLIAEQRAGDQPRWTYLVRNDVPDPGARADRQAPRVLYSRRLRSKVRCQLPFLRSPPDALIVFDNACDIPFWPGKRTVHIDRDRPNQAQLETVGVAARLAHAARCAADLLRAAWFALTVRPHESDPRSA